MDKRRFDERDYQWLIVCLVIAFIFIFVIFFGRKGRGITDYFGFAGTLLSIVLSVLAIIWTYYTSSSSSTQTEMLIDASKQLDSVMKGLNQAYEQITVAARSYQSFEQSSSALTKT